MERIEFRIEKVTENNFTVYFECKSKNENVVIEVERQKDCLTIYSGSFLGDELYYPSFNKEDFAIFNHAMRYAQNIIKGKFKVPDDCKSVDIVIEHGKKDTVIVNK